MPTNQVVQDSIEASVSTAASAASAAGAVASKVMYGGAWTGGLGFLLSNEFLGLIGVLVAVAGFLVNWADKRRSHALRLAEDRRQQIEHEARMQALRGGGFE